MVHSVKKRWLTLTLVLTALLVVSIVSVGLALDSPAPAVTAFSPVEGAVVKTTNMQVSFTVYDPDQIMNSGYYIKVNGATFNSTLQYKGHWEEGRDTCGVLYSYWVVDSYNEATISVNLYNLKDGMQNIEVGAKDKLGNVVTRAWSVMVAVPPAFSNMLPAGQDWQPVAPTISVKAADPNSQIDPASIKLAVDEPVNLVDSSFNAATGEITFTVPAPGLTDGIHTVYVSAKDAAGNEGTASWTFPVHAVGPALTFINADKAYSIYNPIIEVEANDPAEVSDQGFEMYIDGQKADPAFAYYTYTAHDTCGIPYDVTDKTKAFIRFSSTLADGKHSLTVKTKDMLGNYNQQTWYFQVAQSPVLSEFAPADGATVNGVRTVSAKVYDPNGPALDFAKFNLIVDGKSEVFDTVYNPDGSLVVSYTDAGLPDDGTHTASLAASDTLGNSVTKQWQFYDGFVGVDGQFTKFMPEDTAFATAHPSFQVHFTDLNNSYDVPPVNHIADTCNDITVKSGTRVLIDGAIQADNERGDFKNHGDKIPTVTGAAPEYLITYKANTVKDGRHTLTVNVPSKTGGQPAVFTREFTVGEPPVVLRHLPVGRVTTNTPAIAVSANDNSGISKVVFTIDANSPVTVTNPQPAPYDNTNLTSLSYTAPQLSDGPHEISAVLYDTGGLKTVVKWDIIIDADTGIQKAAMPVNDNATCRNCHQQAYNNGTNGGQHPIVPSCLSCHTLKEFQSYTFQNCTTCHYGGPSYSARHVTDGYVAGWRDIQNLRHPINDTHLAPVKGCEQCHSRILTVEHNDRNDRSGNPIGCATCHINDGSAESAVVAGAIRDKNTDCSACHQNANHEAVHADELDADCQTCHAASLTKEHTDNTTTQGKGYSCATCHSSTGKAAQRTIAEASVSCSGCHQQGHNVLMADAVPGDIPLYQGYLWTTPDEASLFSGDPAAPAGYEGGQFIFSNRLASVSALDLWAFYSNRLTANGWALQSQAPAPDAAAFTAVFTKDKREVTVRCYNTANSDGTGGTLGYRNEVWYK